MVDFTGGTWRSLIDGSELIAIPDEEIYLQDDWGDNKLTDREGSATTTYNGVEGVYRPEWATLQGSASVDNENLTLNDDPTTISAGINLNLNEKIRWWFEFDDNGGRNSFGLFAETEDLAGGSWESVENGYILINSNEDGFCRLVDRDDDGTSGNNVIDADGSEIASGYIGATRESDGTWEMFITSEDLDDPDSELFINDNSLGTGTDTTYTDPQYLPIAQVRSTGSEIKRLKVF